MKKSKSTKAKKSAGKSRARSQAKTNVTTKRVVRTITRPPEPHVEEVTERRVLVTEPEVEIRRPATLSAAFSVPTVAVVKPRTRLKSLERKRRIA